MTSPSIKVIRSMALCAGVIILAPTTASADDTSQNYLTLATSLCHHPDTVPPQLAGHTYSEEEIVVRQSRIGREKHFSSPEGSVKLEIIEPAGRSRRTAMTASHSDDLNTPAIWMILDDECNLIEAKSIVYDNDSPLYIQTLDQSFTPLPGKEWLNPPLPDIGRSDGLRVALIDSGVNYQLDEIAHSLAVDKNGTIIGYDFWDDDQTPFDANPARSLFFVQRHGTRTASITLREAPDIALVPYRYPRPDMSRMTRLVEHAAANDIRIIGMPLGSNNKEDWLAFSESVRAHPEILFIASAGNNGRDIDINPVYPAALEHPNILVVTSADDFVYPAERTNYGKLSVDYLLPAENIVATDFSGTQTRVSGSSYAVARMTALAARVLGSDPTMSLNAVKTAIAKFSVKANTSQYATTGYIGDPMADTANLHSHDDGSFEKITGNSPVQVTLNLVALDDTWTTQKIQNSLAELNSIYAQCNFGISTERLIRVRGADYISNLSPGNALTLHRHLEGKLLPDAATIFFATDTDMQTKFDAEAFGRDNTGNRPWMRNSVWISSVTPDTGNAIAHELFHVLTNSGRHSRIKGNLMQDRTSPENTELSEEQCRSAITTARSFDLMSAE